jgi:hypothetical protein
MKHVNIFANETKKFVGNPKSKVDFDSASKDEGIKELIEKPFTLYEVKNITKNKSLMCMNIFQPWINIIQPCYNNLLKPMFYSKTWMFKLDV